MTPSSPLAGVRVVVTRAEHQAGSLVESVAALGADVVQLPLLEVVPPADEAPLERAVSELPLYDWVVFTSVNAVAVVIELAGALPPQLRVAAIGPATARALRDAGVEPHVVAANARAEGLLDVLAPALGRGQRILLPQAADARPVLARGLAELGAEPVAVAAYTKRIPPESRTTAATLLADGELGWWIFTSPSTVRHLAELLGPDWGRRRGELRAVSIGGVTTAALRDAGVEPAAEAVEPSPEGLAAALAAAVAASA